jgi:hypothetical protein
MITRRGVLICGSAAALAKVDWAMAQTSDPVKELRMDIDIKRVGSRPSQKGPEEWFTGTVRIDPLFAATEPARVSSAHVTFEPGARTAWHTHPLGQTLIVTVASDGSSARAALSRKYVPATLCGFRPD